MTAPPSILEAMRSAVDEGVFPGAVLAVRLRSQLQFVVTAGRLSAESASPPVQPSTIYDLASLTKPLVTTTSVLLLVQRAMIRLDDPIHTVLKELKGSDIGDATTEELLTHSSGLPGWRPLYERLAAKGIEPGQAHHEAIKQTVLNLIRDEPLMYARGTRSLYSDLGFILLGLVIERLTGHPLDKWFQESVARPLRAAPLLFAPVLTAAAHAELKIDLTRIAPTEYDTRRNILLCGEVHDENAAALGGVAGHAGVFGTADAVLSISDAWLQARRRKTSLLNSDLVTRFTTRRQGMYHSSWALGWDTPSVPSSSGKYFSAESFGHLGYTGTSLWVDPAKELEVVLLSNRVHPSRTNETIRDFRPRIHDLVIQECVG